jgi:hypothetical protein
MVGQAVQPDRENPELVVVPVFGHLGLPEDDPEFSIAYTLESNNNAHTIAQKFGVYEHVRLSFRAFIPEEFTKDTSDLEVIKHYIESNVTYKQVFGEEGKIHQLDTLISSTGVLDSRAAWVRFSALFGRHDIEGELKDLRKAGVVGDIGQHFVTIQGLEATPSKAIANINKRVIGLDAEKHFIGLVERHRQKEKPRGLGLVIINAGKHKAYITIAAMRSGINHLIIDEELGQEILRILKDEEIDK